MNFIYIISELQCSAKSSGPNFFLSVIAFYVEKVRSVLKEWKQTAVSSFYRQKLCGVTCDLSLLPAPCCKFVCIRNLMLVIEQDKNLI